MTAILTIAPPNAASGRPTAEPPPGTVKELALAVDRTREDCQRVQTLRWLRPGPFSGLIVQAHFQVPFKREECSPDPVETLAAVYLKLRRHWPQMVGDGAWWLVGVMRAWWGGLPKPAGTEVPGRDLPVEEDDEEEDDEPDDPIVGSVRVDFSTAGAYTSVPITRDYRADIEFDDDDISTMEIIRERFRVGEISRDSARRLVQNLINELVKAQFENGEAEETDTRYGDICDGDDYFDDEAIGDDDIESYGPACDIVRCW